MREIDIKEVNSLVLLPKEGEDDEEALQKLDPKVDALQPKVGDYYLYALLNVMFTSVSQILH